MTECGEGGRCANDNATAGATLQENEDDHVKFGSRRPNYTPSCKEVSQQRSFFPVPDQVVDLRSSSRSNSNSQSQPHRSENKSRK